MDELNDPRLGNHRLSRVVYSAPEIQARVAELGASIDRDLPRSTDLLLIGLMKGSFVFMADLCRAVPRPLHVDFMRVASYGTGTVTSGEVEFIHDAQTSLNGRSVVIVEDIIDSGTTLKWLIPRLLEREPARLEVCSLLHKRRLSLGPHPRWVGFDAPDEFLVGYGLDHAEAFRHLPYIGALKT